MVKYEKAQANSHAAAGALVCLKRLQTSAVALPTLKALAPPQAQALARCASGALTPEMRGFVRGAFGPLLRAATQQLLIRRPEDTWGFLAEWLFSVSNSDAGALGAASAEATEADVALRRQEVNTARAALARVLQQIA